MILAVRLTLDYFRHNIKMATDQDKESNNYDDQDCSPESLIKHPLQVSFYVHRFLFIYFLPSFQVFSLLLCCFSFDFLFVIFSFFCSNYAI
jgi:hypothetical protein